MILPQPNYKSALVSVLKSPLKKMCLFTPSRFGTPSYVLGLQEKFLDIGAHFSNILILIYTEYRAK